MKASQRFLSVWVCIMTSRCFTHVRVCACVCRSPSWRLCVLWACFQLHTAWHGHSLVESVGIILRSTDWEYQECDATLCECVCVCVAVLRDVGVSAHKSGCVRRHSEICCLSDGLVMLSQHAFSPLGRSDGIGHSCGSTRHALSLCVCVGHWAGMWFRRWAAVQSAMAGRAVGELQWSDRKFIQHIPNTSVWHALLIHTILLQNTHSQ